MLANVTRSVISQARFAGVTGVRLYHENVPKKAHMDEIPVPMGSWQEDFDNKQKKYNRHLAIGVLFAAATLGYVIGSNVLDHKVWGPPQKA